jgi:DNA-binding IclR family transcriptional regulator
MLDSDHPAPEDGREAEQAGIQSVEVGARVLGALASLTAVGSPPMLKTLAEHAGMPPAKAHRYVVSLVRSGLVEREPVTGRYRLGPKARQIGIVALQSMDVMRLGIQELPAVRDRVGHTVALAIWAYHGPTIILVEEVRTSIAVSAHVGQIMPLLSSATGRAFGAWGPDSQVRPMLMDELDRGQGLRPASSIKSVAQAEALFRSIREQGVASVQGDLNPLISALSAPVFDFRGELVAAISTLGPSAIFDTDPEGQPSHALRQAAEEFSASLGYRLPPSPSKTDVPSAPNTVSSGGGRVKR